MVVDTSALIAIVYAEPDHRRLEQAIEQAGTRLVSVASALEASLVMARRAGPTGAQTAQTILDGVIASLGLTIEPVSVAHLGLARDAYLRYGKGMNAAGLDFGDRFSIALAKDSGEPLLFKGDDFTHTDVTPC